MKRLEIPGYIMFWGHPEECDLYEIACKNGSIRVFENLDSANDNLLGGGTSTILWADMMRYSK